MKATADRWIIVGLIGLTIVAFCGDVQYPGGSLRNGFTMFDDNLYVYENAHVRTGLSWSNVSWAFREYHAYNWHPLTWISLMIDREVFGIGAWGFHLTNVLLHVVNVILVFLLFQRTTGNRFPSAFVAMLFAIHPIHVESVAWISERKDVLSACFWLLTSHAYVSYTRKPAGAGRVGCYLLVALLFALGLTAKQMLVTLPFVLFLMDFWPLRRFRGPGLRSVWVAIAEKIPLLLLAIGASLVVFAVQSKTGAVKSFEEFTVAGRMWNAIHAYVAYLGMFLYPVHLAVFYPHPEEALGLAEKAGSIGVLVALTFIGLRLARTQPYVIVGWLWFVGTLVPVIGLVQVGLQARADRYMYIPSLGVSIMIAWCLAVLWERRPAVRRWYGPLAAILVLVYTAGTWRLVRVWQDSETLFRRAVNAVPGNYWAYYNYAVELQGQGRLEEAIRHYLQAIFFKRNFHMAYYNLGTACQAAGDRDQATLAYHRAVELLEGLDYVHPKHAQALNNLAVMRFESGDARGAGKIYARALDLDPRLPAALVGLGRSLEAEGDREGARRNYEEALSVQPDFIYARRALDEMDSDE